MFDSHAIDDFREVRCPLTLPALPRHLTLIILHYREISGASRFSLLPRRRRTAETRARRASLGNFTKTITLTSTFETREEVEVREIFNRLKRKTDRRSSTRRLSRRCVDCVVFTLDKF